MKQLLKWGKRKSKQSRHNVPSTSMCVREKCLKRARRLSWKPEYIFTLISLNLARMKKGIYEYCLLKSRDVTQGSGFRGLKHPRLSNFDSSGVIVLYFWSWLNNTQWHIGESRTAARGELRHPAETAKNKFCVFVRRYSSQISVLANHFHSLKCDLWKHLMEHDFRLEDEIEIFSVQTHFWSVQSNV